METSEAIIQKLLIKNPMLQTDDILERARYINTQKYIAEEFVINEMIFIPE